MSQEKPTPTIQDQIKFYVEHMELAKLRAEYQELQTKYVENKYKELMYLGSIANLTNPPKQEEVKPTE